MLRFEYAQNDDEPLTAEEIDKQIKRAGTGLVIVFAALMCMTMLACIVP